MAATASDLAFRTFDVAGGDRWLERHRYLARLVLGALSVRLQVTGETGYVDMARICAMLGSVADGHMRETAAAALRALGSKPTRPAIWHFAQSWWYQRAACAALAYQADRLTPAWLVEHVVAPRALPSDGCILVSIHHFNQRLGFARMSMLVEELGAVAHFQPLSETDSDRPHNDRVLDSGARLRALSRFCNQVFGPRVYTPRTAPRRGLELLRRGGSLIVLSDYVGRIPASVLGKRWALPPGAIWLAEHSGRPIVPFVLAPIAGQQQQWQLWFGEPMAPNHTALARSLEDCIRRAPTSWTGWRPWYAAPAFAS